MQILRTSIIPALFGLALLPLAAVRAEEQHHQPDDPQAAPAASAPAEKPAAVPTAPMMMMPMMPMMGPAGMGMMGMGGSGPTAMPALVDHIEGRIAFLRAELAITEAQAPQWSEFAEALRASARSHNDTRGVMMQAGAATTLAMRLDQQEQVLSAKLDGVRALKAAVQKLSAALDETQKKVLEELAPMQFRPMMM